jgi:hypothetical protein
MAISTCAHCQNQTFELQEAKIAGPHYQVLLVQCANCGTPVGAVGNRPFAFPQEEEARLKHLEQQVSTIASSIAHIGRMVGALANQQTI